MFRVPRVLIVDDEKDEVDILVEAVEDEGYRTAAAYNGEEALAIARKGDIDLVLLDVMMPRKDGYQVCEELKSDDRTRDISVIFVTAKGAVEDVSGGLDLGAHDYITKPYNIPIAMARVRAALRAKSLQDRLQQQNIELRDLTYTDELTGLRNSRYFDERLGEEVARCTRYDFPLSCLVLEVDEYKEVGNQFGRAPEDDIIGEVGMVLKTNSRSFDIVAREEGSRFWALLPHTPLLLTPKSCVSRSSKRSSSTHRPPAASRSLSGYLLSAATNWRTNNCLTGQRKLSLKRKAAPISGLSETRFPPPLKNRVFLALLLSYLLNLPCDRDASCLM